MINGYPGEPLYTRLIMATVVWQLFATFVH